MTAATGNDFDAAPPRVDAVARTAASLDLALSPAQITALSDHLNLLRRWNAAYNLTSIRNWDRMITHHLADCLAVVAPLRRELRDLRTCRPKLLDVGSGGGLPGAVIAIACPEFDVVCIDAVGKKVAFIRQVAADLQLRHLVARHGRVEQLRGIDADIVVSRAFASLSTFAAATLDCLAPGGRWLAMKGKRPDAELAALPASIDVVRIDDLQVPGLNEDRCLVWMQRRSNASA